MAWFCIHAKKGQYPEGKYGCTKRGEKVKMSDDCTGCPDREPEENTEKWNGHTKK